MDDADVYARAAKSKRRPHTKKADVENHTYNTPRTTSYSKKLPFRLPIRKGFFLFTKIKNIKGEKIMKTNYEIIGKICDRAIGIGIVAPKNRLRLLMDLDCACEAFDIDLDKLLAFDKLSFCHDVSEIGWNLNRRTKQFNNCFLPRSARGGASQ